MISRILFVVVALVVSSSLNAQIIQFEFSGTIVQGSGGHTQVANGESFEAIFQIDTSVPDSESGNDLGIYQAAVTGGSLEFSGGYVSTTDFSGLDVYVYDQLNGYVEGVLIRGANPDEAFFSAFTSNFSTLNSDEMPLAGECYSTDFDEPEYAFLYEDQFGNIDFTYLDILEPFTFKATAPVPEPSGLGLLTLGACLFFRRTRRAV